MQKRFLDFVKTYKWLLIPAIPLFFFVVMLTLIDFSRPSQQINTTETLQPTAEANRNNQNTNTNPIIKAEPNTPFSYDHGADVDEPLELRSDFQSKENFQNGTTKYMFTSSIPSRPNIIVLHGEDIVFNREVHLPELGSLDDFITIYGNPDQILKAPTFYDQEAVTYFYSKAGAAVITNPTTKVVLESHIFPPMSSTEYSTRYKEYVK